MIETEQAIVIEAAIESVWNYVQDIHKWANLMPGMRECTVVDTNESLWILKVGVGALVRTVKVLVHIDQWDGPKRVNFSYKLQGDPVEGRGSYRAVPNAVDETQVTLSVQVSGSGALAPMWEAMSRPLLPKLATSFAARLKTEIEQGATPPASQGAAAPDKPSILAAISKKFSNL
jgi:carbon monoxide dehydrogenase subunit G